MSKLTRQDFGKGMVLLAEAHGVKLSEARIEAYWLVVSKSGVTAESFEAGVLSALKEGDRFPAPSELLRRARQKSGSYADAASVIEAQNTCSFHRQPGNANRTSSEHVWFCPSCLRLERRSLPGCASDAPVSIASILDDSGAFYDERGEATK